MMSDIYGIDYIALSGRKKITLTCYHRALPHAKIYLAFSQSIRFGMNLIVFLIYSMYLVKSVISHPSCIVYVGIRRH